MRALRYPHDVQMAFWLFLTQNSTSKTRIFTLKIVALQAEAVN